MRKIIYLFILIFALGCSSKTQNTDLFHISVTHFNDTHTTAQEMKETILFENKKITIPVGGYARLINATEELSHESNNIRLFAGDAFQKGNVFFEIYGADFDCKMLQMAKVDVMVLGNHEFDAGLDGLKKLLSCIKNTEHSIDVLAANLTFDQQEIAAQIKPYVIKTINGRKIGIAGLSVPNTSSISFIKGLGFKDSKETAKNIIKEMQAQGVNIIIFITHQGFYDDIALAESVKGIDLIVGGHSHTIQGDFSLLGIESEIENYPYIIKHSDGNKTFIVTASSKTKNIGFANVYFDNNGNGIKFDGNSKMLIGSSDYFYENNPLPQKDKALLTKTIKNNPSFLITDNNTAAKNTIDEFKNNIDPKWFKIKFTTSIDLKTLRDTNNHLNSITTEGHSTLGVYQALSVMEKAHKSGYKLHTALVNTGSLKRNLPSGDVTEWTFSESVPYNNQTVIFSIKGQHLIEELKKAIHRAITEDINAMPCLAKLKLKYTHNNSYDKSSISEIFIYDDGSWKPFNLHENYTIAVSSFIFNGGDLYNFKEYGFNVINTNFTDKDAFSEYLNYKSPLQAIDDTITVEIP